MRGDHYANSCIRDIQSLIFNMSWQELPPANYKGSEFLKQVTLFGQKSAI